MDHSFSYSQKDCNSNLLSKKKVEFWIGIDEATSKYRDIPVFQTLDDFKSSDIYCENVSGIKESKKFSNILKGDTYQSKNPSRVDTKTITVSTKKRTKLDPSTSVTALQFKHYPDHSFHDRLGQGSMSEPNLCSAKDRGDSINHHDFYREDNLLSHKYAGDGKVKKPKDRGVTGCIYVKSGGKVYKSVIETRNLQAVDDIHFSSSAAKHEKCDKMSVPLRYSFPGKKQDSRYKTSRTNEMKDTTEVSDDFEIAIFLSGIKTISEKSQKKHRTDNRKKDDEHRMKQEGKGKKKKKIARKNETTLVLRKTLDVVSETYPVPSKMLTIKPYGSGRIFANDRKRIGKSRIDVKFSSESESEYIFEVSDKTANTVRGPGNVSGDMSNLRSIASNENENQIIGFNNRLKKNEDVSCRSKGTAHTSYYHFSDVCGMAKPKVSDEELWEKFETIFRSYASTTRHSGEVIPRKISTDWMTNAGVVDEIMTEKEADDAFRHAAGAKITMNSQEYKEFLIMLTLRMKLPYYEIYRRMCGI